MVKFYKLSILLITVFVVFSSALQYEVLETMPSAGLVPQDFAYDVKIVNEHSSELFHKLYFDTTNATIKPPYKFHISIEREEEMVCSGAAIRYGQRQYIITAASCRIKNTDIVRVNSAKTLSGGSVYKVKCVINHPHFRAPRADIYDNDVAIVSVDSDDIFTETDLQVRQTTMPYVAQTTTYAQYSKKAFKNTLMITNVSIYSRKECEDFGYKLTNNMVCAGYFNLTTSFCNVDHGSPLFDQSGLLLGIKSWGGQCSKILLPEVYTKISEMANWIYDTLTEQPQC